MKGILLVNKAKDMTSHDVIAILRRKLNIKRIGHTGTLDPMATGVLPVCVGKATRVSEYIMHQGKSYIASLKFGQATDTYDSTGKVIETSLKKEFSIEEVEKALMSFKGEISQKPPMYSAIKLEGKKLYDIARQGKKIDVPERKVKIYDIKLLSLEEDCARIYIACSKGTYIRSLIHDLGISLGSFAYMTDLTRDRVGKFTLDSCIGIHELKEMEVKEIENLLINIEDSLYNLGEIHLFDETYKSRLMNGQRISLRQEDFILKKPVDQMGFGLDNIKVFVKKDFLGIGSLNDKILKMERMLV